MSETPVRSLLLAEQVSTNVLATIAAALPADVQSEILTSQVEQVYVWVASDAASAQRIVDILKTQGFGNVKVDVKGTTITAQSAAMWA